MKIEVKQDLGERNWVTHGGVLLSLHTQRHCQPTMEILNLRLRGHDSLTGETMHND